MRQKTKKEIKRSKRKNKKKKDIISILFIIIIVGCIGYIAYHQWQSYLSEVQFADLKKSTEETLKKKYPMMVGWVKIKDTKINYPVMRNPKNNSQYWLRRGLNKKYSISGTPFIDPNTDIVKSYNWLIYGHNMLDGTMFNHLNKFKDSKFRKKHKTIQLTKFFDDGTYNKGNYKIFAVYQNSIYDKENHMDYPNLQTRDQFKKYIDYCKRKSLYKSKIKPEFGDELVSLSTCSYHVAGKHGRIVVVGIREATT